MADEQLVRTVDYLYGLENSNLLMRLEGSGAFISDGDRQLYFTLAEMVEEEHQNAQVLAEVLDQLSATPGLRRVHSDAGFVAYDTVRSLLERLVRDKKRMIAEYDAAQRRVSGNEIAAAPIEAIATRHRIHLEKLESLLAEKTPA